MISLICAFRTPIDHKFGVDIPMQFKLSFLGKLLIAVLTGKGLLVIMFQNLVIKKVFRARKARTALQTFE